MPTNVTAGKGDTLCGIAMNAGFLDCDRIRLANPQFNSRALAVDDIVIVPDLEPKASHHVTDQIHKFVKKNAPPVFIRIVHGSKDKKYRDDVTTDILNISNYVPDAGGLQGVRLDFPPGFGYDPKGDEDLDTLKVEVVDPAASGTVNVTLEALRPFYAADGTLDHHDTFAGVADAADRRIDDLECKQVASGNVAFRSRYLRLVVDKIDRLGKQQLLITDMANAGDPQVEILDQNVRASYVVKGCKAGAFKCKVTFDATIDRGRTMDLAIRIMRAAPKGKITPTPLNKIFDPYNDLGADDDGIIKMRDIRKRVQTFVRGCWAQSHVRSSIVTLQTQDFPSDSIVVADRTGLPAKGNQLGNASLGQVGFTLNVQRFNATPNTVHVIAPFNIPAGSTPQQTGDLIKQRIDGFPGLTATVSPNSPETGTPDGSCDVLIAEASGGRVTVTGVNANANQDEDQKVQAFTLGMTIQKRNAPVNYHVGHPEQRNLVKSLDTPGDVVIDIQVVGVVPGTRGFTVPELKTLNANRQPVPGVRNSIIMPSISTDSTVNNPFSFPHEIGHILTDEGLHSTDNTQLMRSGTSGTSSLVDDSKRILEHRPAANNWEQTTQNGDGSVNYGGSQALNAVEHINTGSGNLLH
ncbi:MAG: hypothetical protein ABJF23_31120 [Bryobacteraceae bacterium]